MASKLIIIGAKGHGKVCGDIALKMKQWHDIFYLSDDATVTSCLGCEVIGKTDDAPRHLIDTDFFVAIGNNEQRKVVFEKIRQLNAKLVTLIHPSAVIGLDVTIGAGTVLMAGTIINSSTQIGQGCIINTGSSIDHDCALEDFVHVSPGVHLAGTVHIGMGSWLGIGSTISNNVTICDHCIIGAGGVVLKDINQAGTYVGFPVKMLQKEQSVFPLSM